MFFYVLSADALSSSEQVLFNAMTCARFEVKLPANPTTGFQWTLQKYDRERFSFEKDLYVAPETKRMGASGMHIFYFKQKENAPCPESTVLCFRHARAWESESSTCTEVTVHFSKKDLSKN
ncbi:MAG: protease inhibitor I42 family protein [Legionellaceae bacterium]|nr:protease inhibitor I42 family protein [Legionellaceae bacterium]